MILVHDVSFYLLPWAVENFMAPECSICSVAFNLMYVGQCLI